MLEFRNKYALNTYSQQGEDGILSEIFKRIKVKKGIAVEFGANDGKFCSNTRSFLEKGWAGTLIEANPALTKSLEDNTKGLDVTLHPGVFVTPENVNEIVPDCDLLSIDCDGPDYEIWKAFKGEAKVVVIEVNSSYPEWSGAIMKEGTAYKPMVELGLSKGYFPVCHTGNAVFVLNKYKKLFPEIMADPISEIERYFDKSWL